MFSKLTNKLSSLSKNNIFWVVLIIAVIFPTFSKLTHSGFFPMQDDLQAFRVFEMDRCFDDLQIPCRWVPDAGYVYGYPQFNFYPPLPYYMGALMHRVGIQYIDSVKILFILGYILSAITMFVLVDELAKSKWAGFVSSILYTFIPYKAVEVYVRGALSEFWAQIFFPLIFWAIYKLIKSGKLRYLVWTSLGIFFLMTTHLLMTIIFVPVAIVWALFWLIKEKWNNLPKVVWSGLLGFCLSAFFVLPVLIERKFVHTEGILSGYFDYRQHFVNLYKLFISREWGYGSSGFPNEKLNLSLGMVQWILGLVVAPILAIMNYKKTKKLSLLVILLSVASLISVFMIHMKSSFIWAKIPTLWYMQFPWRFLALSIFLFSLLGGLLFIFIKKGKHLTGIVLMLAAIVLNINFFVPKDWLNITDIDKFSGVSWQKQLTISIFDYLPIYAKLPPISEAPQYPEILEGEAEFLNYTKGSDYQYGDILVEKAAVVRLPLFDFPGMKVWLDDQVIEHKNDDCRGEEFCLGLITVNVAEGNHQLKVELTDTWPRMLGNYLTLIGAAATLYIVLKNNEKDNK